MTVLELFSPRLRALALAGLAGTLGVMGAVQASSAQTAPTLKPVLTPPIVAQQLVTLPAEPVSFVVEEWTVPVGSTTIDSSGPGFLIGSTGSAVVASERTGYAVLLSAGEAAPLYPEDRYQAKSDEPASIWTIGLQESPTADASFVGKSLEALEGTRDLELQRAALGQQDSITIESEAGSGLLLVLEGTVLVETNDGSSAMLSSGEAIELDDSTPVTGIEPASIVLAVTVSEQIVPSTSEPTTTSPVPSAPGDSQDTTPTIRVDSDGDGLYDDEEAALGSDPNNVDTDQDGLSDGDEVHIYGSSPTSADTDGDGLPDYNEVMQQGTDPANPDTDGDGLSDHDELNYEAADPTKYDSDGDGLNDYEEVLYGASSETDDFDGDGLTDYDEAKVYGTAPYTPDTDGDGLGDYAEVMTYGTNPTSPDTDMDGRSDKLEVDDGSDPLDPNSPQN